VDKLVGRGCLFVCTGHPDSPTSSYEWRYSFSVTERTLVWTFTDVQRKCFFLLKMLCKEIIGKRISDVICSYHMKILMFWQIEETDRKQGFTGNLLSMVHACLCRLQLWIARANIPSYFIPENNLIDHKHKSDLKQVEQVLKIILIDLSGSVRTILEMNESDALLRCGMDLILNLSVAFSPQSLRQSRVSTIKWPIQAAKLLDNETVLNNEYSKHINMEKMCHQTFTKYYKPLIMSNVGSLLHAQYMCHKALTGIRADIEEAKHVEELLSHSAGILPGNGVLRLANFYYSGRYTEH
jgi:hypothetical protein